MDITIVRALHEGNWKPEPAALEIFAAQQASRGMNIRLVDHPLAKIHEIDPKPALVIVSGIEAHHFTPEQIAAIKSCISEDGVILFETIGGRGEFAASAEIMMEQAFGKSIESVLRTSLITGQDLADAVDLTQVEYRPFSMQAFGTRETAPRLRGMTIDEARGPQLLFSREDISHALLDQPCWGISGYSPHSARALMNNILRFASKSHASQ